MMFFGFHWLWGILSGLLCVSLFVLVIVLIILFRNPLLEYLVK